LQSPKLVFDMHSKNKSMMNQYHDLLLLTDTGPLIWAGQICCYFNALSPTLGAKKDCHNLIWQPAIKH